MAIDTAIVGSIINALPLDKMFTIPLMAAFQAQLQMSKGFADFLMSVCIKDGKAVQVQFDYEDTIVDANGVAQGVMQRTIRIPLLAAIPLPIISIEDCTIDFELTVSQTEESKSALEAGGSIEASLGWGPFKVAVHGQISHKSEQTRKTDTRAKYTIHMAAKRQDPPEALMRVIDALTNAATKPSVLPVNNDIKPVDTLKNTYPTPKTSTP